MLITHCFECIIHFSGFFNLKIVKIKCKYSFKVVPMFKAEKKCDNRRKTHIFSNESSKKSSKKKKTSKIGLPTQNLLKNRL